MLCSCFYLKPTDYLAPSVEVPLLGVISLGNRNPKLPRHSVENTLAEQRSHPEWNSPSAERTGSCSNHVGFQAVSYSVLWV